jgi:hypothetical protein
MSNRAAAHAQHALELEVKINNTRLQTIERMEQSANVATTLPFLREQIKSLARSCSWQISELLLLASDRSAQIDSCPLLQPAKAAPAVHLPISKGAFDRAVIALIGAEKHAQLIHSGYNRTDFCLEIARAALIDEMECADQLSMSIIKTTAKQLWRGDGTLGLSD